MPPAGSQQVETAYIERTPVSKLSKIRQKGLVLFREFYWDVVQNTVQGNAGPGYVPVFRLYQQVKNCINTRHPLGIEC